MLPEVACEEVSMIEVLAAGSAAAHQKFKHSIILKKVSTAAFIHSSIEVNEKNFFSRCLDRNEVRTVVPHCMLLKAMFGGEGHATFLADHQVHGGAGCDGNRDIILVGVLGQQHGNLSNNGALVLHFEVLSTIFTWLLLAGMSKKCCIVWSMVSPLCWMIQSPMSLKGCRVGTVAIAEKAVH